MNQSLPQRRSKELSEVLFVKERHCVDSFLELLLVQIRVSLTIY